MTSIKPDSIDVTAGNWERLDKLVQIINNILDDTDPGDDNKDKRRWILWHFLYIMWHEGKRATARVQDGGGPGRGLMQIEPQTLWDLFKNYILGTTKGLIKNLADAAGVKEDEMKEAIKDFVDNNWEEYEEDDPDDPNDPPKKIKKKTREEHVARYAGTTRTISTKNKNRKVDKRDRQFWNKADAFAIQTIQESFFPRF